MQSAGISRTIWLGTMMLVQVTYDAEFGSVVDLFVDWMEILGYPAPPNFIFRSFQAFLAHAGSSDWPQDALA
jgi:hypothetical protein